MDIESMMLRSAGELANISGMGSRERVRLTEEELDRRLSYYERENENLHITDTYRQAARAIFCDHANVLVTGGAGTGKTSFVNGVLMPELTHRSLNFALTAMTGIASSHVGGTTIHRWAGIGILPQWDPRGTPAQDLSAGELLEFYEKTYAEWADSRAIKPAQRAGILRRIRNQEVLIVDEISMCAGDAFLGFLDHMMRMVREDDRPFGGVQMVFVGDFAQLPPVEKWNRPPSRPDWAFLSNAWQRADVRTIELKQVFRQTDARFVEFLNSARVGLPIDQEYARRFVRYVDFEESLEYTKIVPTNRERDAINNAARLYYPEPERVLDAEIHIEPDLLEGYDRNNIGGVREKLVAALNLIPKTLFLRTGLPVMFAVNSPDGTYVNGTQGFLREIHLEGTNNAPAYDADYLMVGVPQKDGKERSVKVFRWGFSRSRYEDPAAMEDLGGSLVFRWPVIRQFPIMPSSAITAHKSQGMSLDRAILSLARSFAPGQVYVALSRLRTSEGLILMDTNFQPEVDRYVMAFYGSLQVP